MYHLFASCLAVVAVGTFSRMVEATDHPLPIEHNHHHHRLTLDTMSQSVRRMEYAVRGAVVILADEISRELRTNQDDENRKKYPLFDHIVYTNIGNPQYVACCLLGLFCVRRSWTATQPVECWMCGTHGYVS